MLNSKYQPILTESTRKNFLNYIQSLSFPEIDYFAIGLQNTLTKKSISLMSCAQWQEAFYQKNYAPHDPVRQAALYTKKNIIPFSDIEVKDKLGQEIMQHRARLGMKHGVVLMQRFGQFNYMVTLATGFSKFNPHVFLQQDPNQIQSLKKELMYLIREEAKEFFLTSTLM
jgi:Autoinducer binding domain